MYVRYQQAQSEYAKVRSTVKALEQHIATLEDRGVSAAATSARVADAEANAATLRGELQEVADAAAGALADRIEELRKEHAAELDARAQASASKVAHVRQEAAARSSNVRQVSELE